MNFFDAQDKARRSTRWLVVVYVVATALIVAGVTAVVGAALYTAGDSGRAPDPSLLAATALLATLLIIGSTLYKTAQLSSGGGRVASDMGGTLISPEVRDPLRRRLRNVVEEMAIASGVPVPEIYVLEEEGGINAFAAGFTPADAAVAVTRGCLELLDRDELQGVIAHEFSHILNGDMRLNIRMMGVLFGIMVLGIIGRMILRGSYHGTMLSSRRNKNAPVVMIVGIGFAILGWIGVFMARMVKAAVSRQREFLADASAVQYTRQTQGIADALKKIGGYSGHSYIKRVDPEEVSHMLFAGGVARFSSMFATHPPLAERIRALDPSFSEADYPSIEPRDRKRAVESEASSAFAAAQNYSQDTARQVSDTIAETVGAPEAQHIEFAQRLRSSIPAPLYAAAHAPDDALLLALALGMSDRQQHADRQLSLVNEQIGDERGLLVRQFHELLQQAGVAYRLPLLEVSFPALKNRPAPQIEFLLDMIEKLIELDGQIELREYCFYRILKGHLLQSIDPKANAGNRVSKKAAQEAAVDLVRLVANRGHDDAAAARSAFAAGTAAFGAWAGKVDEERHQDEVVTLGRSLDVLSRINSAGQQSLLRAVSETITHDGRLTLEEAELLRTICAALQCPLPPILERA